MSSTGTIPTAPSSATTVHTSRSDSLKSPTRQSKLRDVKTEQAAAKLPPRSEDVQKITLAAPSFPAMDYLVQESASNKVKMDDLQTAADFIFKTVAPVPGMKTTTNNIYSDVQSLKVDSSAHGTAIARIEAELVTLRKNQEEMLSLLKSLVASGPSFTAEDRGSLGSIIKTQAEHTTSIQKVASDVHTMMIHSLPDDHIEGERAAKELADELIGNYNATTTGPQISPYNKPVVVEDDDDEEEEEEEEENEEDDEIPLYGGNQNQDDDDDDELPPGASQFFKNRAQIPAFNEIFISDPSGDVQPQHQSEPSRNDQSAQTEGELAAK